MAIKTFLADSRNPDLIDIELNGKILSSTGNGDRDYLYYGERIHVIMLEPGWCEVRVLTDASN